jgi:hypothetical protein
MLGSVFWLGLDKMPYLDDDTREYLDAALRLRARLTPLIRGARYVDMDGVLSVSDGIEVGHWEMADDRDLYIVANPGRVTDGMVVVPTGQGAGNADSDAYKHMVVDDFDIDGGSGRVRYEPCSEELKIRLHDAEVVCILTK